jgi:hypothetical protein
MKEDRMLNNFIRAQYYWERGESEPALSLLNAVFVGDEPDRAFYWTNTEVEHELLLPFEIAVTNILLTEDVRRVPFDIVFTRLWNTLPVQYLILALVQWSLDRERDDKIIDLLSQGAATGLVSTNASDYDLSGKVVLDPYAYPEVVEFLGGDAFLAIVEQATVEDAWGRSIAPDAALVINLFLYAVFHRERLVRGEMILIRLERIADSHGPFLQAFSGHLDRLLTHKALHAPLVSVGLRIDQAQNPSECLWEFADAVRSHRFEPFVRRYFQSNNCPQENPRNWGH